MLQAIRERVQGIMAWVILIMISVPFALWGIQNYFNVGKELPVAVVGDKEIFQRDVNRAFQQTMETLGGNLGQFSEESLKSMVLNRLVDEEVVFQAARDIGFAVDDLTISKAIQAIPYFQTDGKFDKEKFRSLLAQQNMSQAQLAQQMRRSLALEQYRRGILDSEFVAAPQLEEFFRLKNQLRDVEYAVIPVKESNIEVTDEDIDAYYRENSNQFRTQEQTSISYVELKLDDIAAEVKPSEEDLRSFYEEQIDNYTSEERRKISHILIEIDSTDGKSADQDALQRVGELKKRIEKGEDFADLAKEFSKDTVTAKKGGNLGFVTPGVMDPSFEEAALGLVEGEVSDPVKTPFGYHLIKVTALTPSKVKSFEDARKELLANYQRNEAETKFYDLGERLAELSYENPDSLEPVVDALNLRTKATGLFSRDKGDGIASEKAVREAAFSEEVREGRNSEPIELTADTLVVLREKEYQKAATKPLAEVKDQIVRSIRTEDAQAAAKQLAKELLDQIKAGKSLDEIAKADGLTVEKPGPLSREDNKLRWELKDAVFKAAKPQENGSTSFTVELQNGEHALASLREVKNGDSPKSIKEDKKVEGERFAQAYGVMALTALVDQLRNQADVEIIEPEN